jgi:serine/threonine protein kinase
MSLGPGHRVGVYEILGPLGSGGMGEVYRARDTRLGRLVAVKFVSDDFAHDASSATRLAREAELTSSLNHPNIVTVHDVGEVDGRPFIVMEFIAGQSLSEAIESGPMKPARVADIACQIADGLAAAHGAGVVHRDLKPRNIMLGPFGEVLVLDWGIARERGLRERAELIAATNGRAPACPVAADVITGTGTVLGTPGYMSPEQAQGRDADERADVFGLGAILRDLARVHPEPIPRSLAAIQDRATALNPSELYDTPLALRDDIRRFLDGARVNAHRESIVEATARLGRVYRTPLILILAYVVMRVAFVWLRRS